MRDNMIVRFGPGHAMAVDRNMEHLVGKAKVFVMAF
jgi:hypothetical protein